MLDTPVWRRAHRFGLMAALLVQPACYAYVDTGLDTVTPGIQARFRLDQNGFGQVANQAALNNFPVQSLDSSRRGVVGRVLAVESSELSVEMRGIGGSVFTADVPTSAIEEVAVRSFSKSRTVGVMAFGVVLAGTLGSGAFGGTTGPGPPPPPDNMSWIPLRLLSIPFR